MLVNLKTILADTREKKYAVGLFNCVTLEMTKGIIAAAEELNSPVIIGPGESLLPGATLAEYADMMLGMAKRAKVPVCLHFDHGFNPDLLHLALADYTDEQERRAVVAFAIHGSYKLLCDWINDPQRISPELQTERILRLARRVCGDSVISIT